MRALVAVVVFAAFLCHAAFLTINPLDVQTYFALSAQNDYSGAIVSSLPLKLLFAAFILANMRAVWVQRRNASVVVAVIAVLAVLSAAWSPVPLRTLNRALDLFLCLGMPLVMLDILGARRVVTVMWATGFAIVVASSLLAAVGSEYALMGGNFGGHWRGLFAHKNSFGLFAASVLLLSVVGRHFIDAPRWLIGLTVLLSAIALLGASSATAMVALLFAFVVMIANAYLSRFGVLRWPVLAVAGIALVFAISLANEVLPLLAELLGRDETLTGRTGLWSAVVPLVIDAPVGYGYGSSGGDVALDLMRRGTGWAGARSTHNSYLELALDLGPAVAVAFAGVYFARLIATRSRTEAGVRENSALVAVTAFLLMAGIAESGMGPYISYQLVLVLTFLAVVKQIDHVALPIAGNAETLQPPGHSDRTATIGAAR